MASGQGTVGCMTPTLIVQQLILYTRQMGLACSANNNDAIDIFPSRKLK